MKKISFFILLTLSGCLSGPNFKEPQLQLPDKFIESKEAGKIKNIKDWWQNFYDTTLNAFIERAIQNNFDVEIAKEKIREARAMYNFEKAQLFPEIDINGSYERRKVSQSLYESRFIGPPEQNLYQLGFDASWEIDIFGKLRRGKIAAYHEVKAMIEEMCDVMISLICEVARDYVEARYIQQMISFQNSLIEKQNQIVFFMEDKFESGLIDEILLENAKQILKDYQAQLEPYKSSLKKTIYRITFLLNLPMGSLEKDFATLSPLPDTEDVLPEALPSDLLLRRPDIRKALQDLASATNRVGEAFADYFPRFSLTGHYGWRSAFKEQMFDSSSNIWWIAPSVYWPLLDFGRIRSNVKAKTSKQKQTLLNYEKTVLFAFQEVESAFAYYFKDLDKLKHVKQEFLATQKQKDLEIDLFQSGIKDQMSALEKAINHLNTEKKLLDAKKEKMIDLIALYKALGGGWICSDSQ